MVNQPLRPFAAILEGQAPWWRIGTSGVLAIAGYLGLLVAALSLDGGSLARTAEAPDPKLVVTLLDRVPSPPPAGPSSAVTTVAAVAAREARAHPPPNAARRSKPAPPPSPAPSPASSNRAVPPAPADERVPAAEPSPSPPAAAAHSGALPGGTSATAGMAHATGNAAARSAPANPSVETVLPFTDGMTRPKLIEMVEPEYTREARDANVKGLFLAKCVITTEGTLQRCRVVKGLAMMDRAVLSALARWRYTPVIYQGRPVAVDYVIQVRLAGP